MSRLRVIFFDAAGTLFHVKGSVGEIYLRYAEQYGFPSSAESLAAVNAAFRRAFQDAPPPVFAATEPHQIKQCERLWWFDVVHSVFYRVGMFERFDDFFEDVFQSFGGPLHWELYPETMQVLKELRAGGMEIGLVSNFDTRVYSVFRGLGVADLFDTVTIASLARAAKPSPRIFREALEKHAVDPEEALHVGDSLHDDLEGAIKAGLVGVWLDRGTGEQRWPEEVRSHGHRIRSLQELPSLVAGLERQ